MQLGFEAERDLGLDLSPRFQRLIDDGVRAGRGRAATTGALLSAGLAGAGTESGSDSDSLGLVVGAAVGGARRSASATDGGAL